MIDQSLKSVYEKIIFIGIAALCLTPLFSPPVALFAGIIFAQFTQNPYPKQNHKITHYLLQISIVGLGFGMNAATALKAGKEGFFVTMVSIFGTLLLGIILGKIFKTDKITSFLISAGTAICGGSAIAALSPVVNAEEKQISVSLGVIFILNSIALFLFPQIGNLLHLSQSQFGLWSAIAIHDTSSVVGSASKFGGEALQIATTIKLTRSLWIIPITFLSSFLFKNSSNKIKIPYFIFLFVLAIILKTYFSFIDNFSPYIVEFSKIGLTLTLFLIGSNLSWKRIKTVGVKPILQGFILWIIISVISLIFIVQILGK